MEAGQEEQVSNPKEVDHVCVGRRVQQKKKRRQGDDAHSNRLVPATTTLGVGTPTAMWSTEMDDRVGSAHATSKCIHAQRKMS